MRVGVGSTHTEQGVADKDRERTVAVAVTVGVGVGWVGPGVVGTVPRTGVRLVDVGKAVTVHVRVHRVAQVVAVDVTGDAGGVSAVGTARFFGHVAETVVVIVRVHLVGDAVAVEVGQGFLHRDGEVHRGPVEVVGGVDGVHREVGELGRCSRDASVVVQQQASRQVGCHRPVANVGAKARHLKRCHRGVDRQHQGFFAQREVNRAVVHVVKQIANAVPVKVAGPVKGVKVAVVAALDLHRFVPAVTVIVVVGVVANTVVVGVDPLGGVNREGVDAVEVPVVVAIRVQAATCGLIHVGQAVVVVVRVNVVGQAVAVEVRTHLHGERGGIVGAGHRVHRDGVLHGTAGVGGRAPQGAVAGTELQAGREVR